MADLVRREGLTVRGPDDENSNTLFERMPINVALRLAGSLVNGKLAGTRKAERLNPHKMNRRPSP